ncbi:MAG: hypothetical protein KDE27_09170 [Planctomycetes bacterium]|nr:hypothetical protein [Planctomycetota bacterium]
MKQRNPRGRSAPAALATLALASAWSSIAVRAQTAPPPITVPSDDTAIAGPATATAPTLTAAAAWLLRHQQPDGRWTVTADPEGNDQRDHNEICVTALAIRALLPGLRNEGLPIARAVRRAAAFLAASQRPDGCFGPEDPFTMMFGHAHALRALCAIQREWPDETRMQQIERGVEWALQAQNPYAGWRYTPKCGDNDSKITATMLLALRDCQALGVKIGDRAFALGQLLLDQLRAPNTGRTGFTKQGETMSRFTSKKAAFPGELSEEPTALHLLVDAAAGKTLEAPERALGVALVAALPPEWDAAAGSIDLAYWQSGAELMQLVGGREARLWRAKLHAALLPNRIDTGGLAHWPAVDAWSHPGMEAYTTASAMLALRSLP